MTALLAASPTRTPERAASRYEGATHAFRHDVQGLRAIAVLLVVLYHAGVPGLPGGYVGVDVFFVISGFLITSLLMRELAGTGRVALGAFYARRARRLLPAAGAVVVATLVAARLVGPPLQVGSTAWDAVWTSTYLINFRLASRGVDYQAASETVSPLQHFWSLAVEEQFYLVWPLLLVLAFVAGRRAGRGRRAVAAAVAAVAAAGLVVSVLQTQASAPTAYFTTWARAWELAAGGVVALGAARLARLPRRVVGPAACAGLGLIVLGAAVLDDRTPFPGAAALLPVIGAAVVIGAGCGPGPGAGRLLDRRPLQEIGRLSYGWYLWHWPVLVLWPRGGEHGEHGEHGVLAGLALGALALVLAQATYVWVERPALGSRAGTRAWLVRGAAISGSVAALALVLVATAPEVVGTGPAAAAVRLTSPDPGPLQRAIAASSRGGPLPSNLVPALSDVRSDRPPSDRVCHLDFADTDLVPCVFGDPGGRRTAVLLGDSHAQHWLGGLDLAARDRGWRLVPMTKAACPAADLTVVNPTLKREYVECGVWRESALAAISRMRPDLVIVSQSDAVPGTSVDNGTWARRTVATLERLRGMGLDVVLIRDTPFPRGDMPSCLAANPDDVTACAVARADAYSSSELLADRHRAVGEAVAARGLRAVEPAPWLCSPETCPVVIGDELVYRDDSHLTDTFSRTLAPLLAPLLR